MVQLSHTHMTTEKTVALTIRIFVRKVMPLLFNMLSRLVIAFLPRSKWFLVSQLHSLSAVILEPKKISLTLFSFVSHLFAMKWWDQMPFSLFSECWVLSQFFHSPLSPSWGGSLVPLCFLPLEWCSYWKTQRYLKQQQQQTTLADELSTHRTSFSIKLPSLVSIREDSSVSILASRFFGISFLYPAMCSFSRPCIIMSSPPLKSWL